MPASQTLMLLRHAKAEPWGRDIDDFGRPLADSGRQDMLRLASWVAARLEAPQAVLCSAAQRTVDTLQPLLEVWPDLAERTRYGRELYHATAGALHELAARALEVRDSVLLVGHNPGFEDLALRFMSEAERRQHFRMPTGTLGVFEFPDGFTAGATTLRLWVRGRSLPPADGQLTDAS